MSKLRLAIAGAGGRMGRALTRIIHASDSCEVVGGFEPADSPLVGQDMGVLAGIGEIGVPIVGDPSSLVKNIDGFIDFTIPEASLTLAEAAADAGLVHIIGTTGFSTSQEASISIAAQRARIVKSGNMSLGVNLLAALIEQAAAALGDGFDIEIIEMHHRHKVDAPSGTALLLGEAAAQGRKINLEENAVKSRVGYTGERKPGDIGFATLRGGSVVGDHSVIFAGQDEIIELSHKAQSREIFANGALKAALWAQDKKPGLYSMKNVLGID